MTTSHKTRFQAALIAASLLPLLAQAATVTSTFSNNYSTSGSLFGSGQPSSSNLDVNLGVVRFEATANTGTVNSLAVSEHTLTFSDELTLSQSSNASFSYRVSTLAKAFLTEYGAAAKATAFGVFDIVDEGATVQTRRNQTIVDFGQAL